MSSQVERLTFVVTEDKGPAIAAISSKLTAIAAAFVFSRLFVRVKVQKRLFCDDFWTVLSMAGAALSNYFLTQAVDNGSGRHITEIDPSQLSSILHDTTFGFIGGILTLGLLKITIVSLLLRVLAPKRMMLTLTWFLGVVSGLSLLAMALMTLFQCSPIDAAWNFGIDAVCWPLTYVLITGYWSGSVSILANFAYLAIPAITLRRTQLSLLKEAGLGLALGVGLLPVAAGVIRTAKLGLLGGADPIFNFCDLLYWTSIEANLTIVAVCVPAFQPLLEGKKERESGIFGEAQHLPAGDEKHGRRALNLFNTVVDPERKA